MDYQAILTDYSNKVISGEYPACKSEILACKRFIDDIKRQNTTIFPYVFDNSRAEHLVRVVGLCRHVKGAFAGKPLILQDWQLFDLCNLFGWVNANTGKRRFRNGYIRIARGNTKSTMMSAIVLYGMTADVLYPPYRPSEKRFEQSPEVVCLATDRQQAGIVWGDARTMALASPNILSRLNVKKCTISNKTRGGSLNKLSKDSNNKDGGAPTMIVIDEYHAHPTSLVKDVVSSGKGKRSQCIEIIITTAGEDSENKPCKLEDDIVKKILNREIIDESYYGMIRELDDNDDVHDEKIWVKANPILREMNEYSKDLLLQIKQEHDLAYGSNDSAKIRQWLIKRVNRWQADSEEKYFNSDYMQRWKTTYTKHTDMLEMLRERKVWVGVDLSLCVDLTAVSFSFRLSNGNYAVISHGFLPENTLSAHEKMDRVPYRQWAADGWLTLTRGDVTDHDCVIDYIKDTCKRNFWSIQEVCFDSYNALHFATLMQNDGYTTVEVRQGQRTLSEPTKRFRELVLQGKLIHDESPLLTWCLSNAYEVSDNNANIKITKKTRMSNQRVDALAAILTGFTRAYLPEKPVAVYRDIDIDL